MAEHTGIEPVNAYILVKTDEASAQRVTDTLEERLPNAQVTRVEGIYQVVVSMTADAEEYVTGAIRDKIEPIDEVEEAWPLLWHKPEMEKPVRGFHHHEEN